MCLLRQPHAFKRSDALNLLQGKAQKWFPITSLASEGGGWCSCASMEAHSVSQRERFLCLHLMIQGGVGRDKIRYLIVLGSLRKSPF